MIKKISDKKKARLASGGSEKALFKRLVLERRRTDTTGRPITLETAKSYQFAHILPKGMYPELRLNPNNIIIVDNIAQHHLIDKIVSGYKYEFHIWVLEGKAVKILVDLFRSETLGSLL